MTSQINDYQKYSDSTVNETKRVSPIKELIKRFSHFFSTSLLIKLLGLITFPILTRILTQEQYGVMGLVSVTMFLMVAIAKAGLSEGITRFYKVYSHTPEQRTVFTSTLAVRGFILSMLITILYLSFFPSVYEFLKIDKKYLSCFMIMAIHLFLFPLNAIISNILKVTGRTLLLNAISLVGRIVAISLSLFLILYVIRNLYGYFVGMVIGVILITIFLLYWFFTHYSIRLNKVSSELTWRLIKFGAPLLFYELSFLLLTYIDRYMLIIYHGEAVLGIYSVGYNLAMYIADVIHYSLLYSIVPIYVDIYESQGKQKTEEFLRKCMHYLLIAIIPICVGYFAVSRNLLIILASKKYLIASTFSPIILLGSLFLLLNNILNAGLYLRKKSIKMLLIMLSAACINIVMNLFLLPRYGIMGATIATLVSCMSTTVLTLCLSLKYIVVKIDFLNVIYHLFLSGVMFLILSQIHISPVWLELIVKVLTGVLIIVAGVLLREKEIIRKVREIY